MKRILAIILLCITLVHDNRCFSTSDEGKISIRPFIEEKSIETSEVSFEENDVMTEVVQFTPQNNASEQELNPEFTWEAEKSVTDFVLQISSSPDFNTFVFNSLVSGRKAAPISPLMPTTEYFWRIKPISESGSGEWSSVWNFITKEDLEQNIVQKIKANGIPILEINTLENAPILSKEEYVKGNIIVHDNSSGTYIQIHIGATEIKGRGNSTWTAFPKKPYRIKLAAAKEFLGMPANRHWVLLANYSDKTLLRTNLAFNLSRMLGLEYTPRDRHVEVVLNGIHVGSYQLVEAIKIARKRVDIVSINSDKGEMEGGVIIEVDLRRGAEYTFDSPKGVAFSVKDPDDLDSKNADEIDARLNYIKQILFDAENSIYSEDFDDDETGYSKHIDVPSFVNWYFVNEILRNNDALFHTSVFMYFDHNKKITMGPVWDFDISAGNNHNRNRDPHGFWIRGALWISRLFQDTKFLNAVTEKWEATRYDLMDQILQIITSDSRTLYNSQRSNFEIWDILGTYVWPNYYIGEKYEDEVFYLKKWLLSRIVWMDTQLSDEPIDFPPVSNDLNFLIFEHDKIEDVLPGFHPIHAIKYTVLSNPLHGSMSLNEDTGEFEYQPYGGYIGEDSFSFVVTTSEGSSLESFVSIKITGNTGPTNILLTRSDINEYLPVATLVGELYTNDADLDESHLYSLVTGEGDDDNESFTIVKNRLESNQIFRHKNKNSFTVRVGSKDKGGLSIEKKFSIKINEVEKKFNISENHKPIVYVGYGGNAGIVPEDIISIPLYFDPEFVKMDKSSFSCDDLGQHLINLSYFGENGHLASASLTVTVLDTIAPVIQIHDITVQLDKKYEGKIEPKDVDQGTYDNCGIAELILSKYMFDANDQPETQVLFTATDKAGNSSSSIFNVFVNPPLQDPKIYPNPANDFLTIEIDPNQNYVLDEVTIFSASGAFYKNIKFEENDGKIILDVRTLVPGLYLMKISNTKGVETLKFSICRY